MSARARSIVAMVAFALASLTGSVLADPRFVAPATRARPVTETRFGVTLTDRYRWLEDAKDPAVAQWTRAQHEATLAWLDAAAPPIEGLREELARYIDRDVTRAPFFRKGHEFFLRTRAGEQQAKLYARLPDGERLLFDPLALDPSGKTAIGSTVPNRDGSRIAVAAYAKGSEIPDWRIVDARTGEQVGPTITELRDFHWARDERYAYVSPRTAESDAKQEPARCYRHRLGAPRGEDELLIEMKDAKDWCSVYEPIDANVTVFETGDFWSNTVKIRPIGERGEPSTIWSSARTRAEIDFRRDRFYVRTNDGAKNWKLLAGDYSHPNSRDWRELWPEQDTVLEQAVATRAWLLVLDKKDVLTRLFVHALSGRRVRELALPELGNIEAMSYDVDADRVYARLASFTAPPKLYAIDGRTLEWTLVWQDDPPLDTSAIEAERVFVPARDGARIPAFVVHRKGMRLDGSNPLLLHGYGGFDIGIAPFYIGTIATFVNRGGVFVDAGIRGGDEYGERWHEQAMLANKQATFDDFVSVAEWLIAEKYTSPARLAVQGGSNGGLTIAAVLTQRPDLLAAAICQVPLTDMVRYQRFLIARYWIPEYGDPDKEADFRTLLAYSPYHHVREGVNLPPTLVTAGEYDSRVDPMHAKKMVARVQGNPGQVSPFLLYMDFDSGHGAGKSRRKLIDDHDYELRFLMHALRMAPGRAR